MSPIQHLAVYYNTFLCRKSLHYYWNTEIVFIEWIPYLIQSSPLARHLGSYGVFIIFKEQHDENLYIHSFMHICGYSIKM